MIRPRNISAPIPLPSSRARLRNGSWKRTAGERDAAILRDDVGDSTRDEQDCAVVVAAFEERDRFATNRTDFAVVENSLKAVSNLSEVLAVVDREQNQYAAGTLLGADAPSGGEVERVLLRGLFAGGLHGDDEDLRVGLVVNFGADRSELADRGGAQDVGVVVDVRRGLGGELRLTGSGCRKGEEKRETDKKKCSATPRFARNVGQQEG